MFLKGRFRVTERYRSKSKISFWEDLEVGDVVEVTAIVRKDYYAEPLMLYNERTKQNNQTTFSILAVYLSKLGYEELDHGWTMATETGVYRDVSWQLKQAGGDAWYNAQFLYTIIEPDGSNGGKFSSLDSLKKAIDERLASRPD